MKRVIPVLVLFFLPLAPLWAQTTTLIAPQLVVGHESEDIHWTTRVLVVNGSKSEPIFARESFFSTNGARMGLDFLTLEEPYPSYNPVFWVEGPLAAPGDRFF